METDARWADQIAFPALLRAARSKYAVAIRTAFLAGGYEDMPRDGAFVLGAIVRTGAPLTQIIQSLRVSKQAASQLVDTLVVRGYLERAADPADRRRLNITLTDRGQGAADAARAAVEAIDTALLAAIGPELLAHTRATLAALIES